MRYFRALVISCEHATPAVPAALRVLFRGQKDLSSSHRAYDRGAWLVAKNLATHFQTPLFGAEVSRLVIDHNRSLHHQALHSKEVLHLESKHREDLIKRYYIPFRTRVYEAIERACRLEAPVLHLSIHSFTPVLNGKRRIAELGLLYDPSRFLEASLCRKWRLSLIRNSPHWRVRRNYPYAGWTDGHTTALREQFPASRYAGVEVEINQSLTGAAQLLQVAALLRSTLSAFVKLAHSF